MKILNTAALLVSLAALFGYLNHRFVRLPTTIGLMLIALVMSLGIIALGKIGIHFDDWAREVLSTVDFDETLLHGMLSFLLFAGALHVNLRDLAKQKWVIGFLATFGVLLSTLIVGYAAYWLFGALGHPVPLIYCLLFGALISPTDPIAVLSMLRSVGVETDIEMKIAGESLFNDGVAVVVFTVMLGVLAGGREATVEDVLLLFSKEAIGGAVFGLAIGFVAYRMLASLDNYQVEILITLALVMGGYALATALHVSGPIAIVVAGLLIGNHGRRLAMSDKTREHLDTFWELVDEILNAVLFMLIGLEVLLLTFERSYLWAALLVIPVVLLARLASVSAPTLVPAMRREFSPYVIRVLTWGGLRGGISVALALSLPGSDASRDIVITVTYVVVVFSMLVQGLTFTRVVEGLPWSRRSGKPFRSRSSS